MTNYAEHDDATIKIIGVKQGPRKMSIVHMMCVCVLPENELNMNHPVETCSQTVDEVKRLSQLNCTVI